MRARRRRSWHPLAAATIAAIATAPFPSPPAWSHESGASTLHLRVDGPLVEGEWELTARDARALLGLPLDREPDTLDAGELQSLSARFLERVRIEGDGRPCTLEIAAGPELARGAPPTAKLSLRARCESEVDFLRIVNPLLFDLDPRHRAYFSLRDAKHTQAGVFRSDAWDHTLAVAQPDPVGTFVAYAREGAWHVFAGLDHVLFLVCLLLPVVMPGGRTGLVRPGSTPPTPRRVMATVLGIVTAFTVAHSLTLALSVLGVVSLPARPVEVVIALSVFAAAWNNVRPFLPLSGPWIALGFGLVHGLGFASALVRLGLPQDARVLSLVGFNVGVEIGQLAIVSVLLPIELALRGRDVYARRVVPGVSLVVAWLALVWTLERAFGLSLLPGT